MARELHGLHLPPHLAYHPAPRPRPLLLHHHLLLFHLHLLLLLLILLQVAELLGVVDVWKQQKGGEGGVTALSQALTLLDSMPLLPAEPVQVDEKQARFRQLPAALQRVFPALLEAAMASFHAKYISLKLPRAAGGGNAAEMVALRRRGEAVVAMSGVSAWMAAEVLGQLQMPTAVSQRLASWLAEMA